MKTEILEGNKLIAEFMGLKYNPYATGRYGRFWINDKSKGSKKIGAGFKELKYHASWDWIMQVVDKIIEIDITSAPNWTGYRVEIVPRGYVKITGLPMHTITTNVSIEGTLIKAVWLAIVEFIKWYNQNNNQ